MTANGRIALWQKMLLDFDERAEFWLNEMYLAEPNSLFDKEFEKIFLKVSSDR